jgi:hypothetical protein
VPSYRNCITRAAAPLIAVTAIAVPVHAQTPLDSPFHQGQWSANVAVNGLTFGSVDLLKFTSPTRAWVLSGNGFGRNTRVTGSPSFTEGSAAGIQLTLQRRFLKPVSPHAVLYLSPGILGSFAHSCNSAGPGSSICGEIWQAGVITEVGAEYVVGRHLGVGARYRASLSYDRNDFAGFRMWSIDAAAGSAGVFASIIF